MCFYPIECTVEIQIYSSRIGVRVVSTNLLSIGLTVNAKPRCQGFNNYDNKVTIVFTDNQAKDKYTVSDVKLIPSSWSEKEYPATSVEVTVKKGVATVTLTFPHVTQFSNPQVTLRINGKKSKFKVCQ